MSVNYYISNKSDSNKKYSYESMQMKKENSLKEYAAFAENVRVYFLSEGLNYLLSESLDDIQYPDYGREICRSFVREEGYNNLMRKFSSTTYTLAQLEQCVREACDTVICSCDKDDKLTWIIKDTDQQKFFDSLKDLPASKLTKAVNQRVCDAAEEFVQRNINMKLDIEDIATRTKERIDDAKAKYDEKKAAQIQKEQMALYKSQVNKIKSESPRNVYAHMMNIASKSIIESDSLRESYLDESGQFDMATVESRVKTMYTFLEMAQSLKIKKVDNKYIEECLSSIK